MLKIDSFQENMIEFRKQLEKGTIKVAYRGLMEYIMGLKTYFNNRHPNYFVSGSIYYGYMDMTYFSFTPESLKHRKLKIAIVFNYNDFRFEVWLSGYNKQVQNEYWTFFKNNEWDKYHLVSTTKDVDSIIEYVLVENPDFSDLDKLTKQVENGTLKFIEDIENFLSKH